MAAALAALGVASIARPDAGARISPVPGLYAIRGSRATWGQLGLGDPPDDRPLYVGKAEESLVSRDLGAHFGDGRTGSSTLRRSFAALLHGTLGLRGLPRNTATPGYYANYGLSREHDAALTEWMWRELELAVWAKPSDVALIERAVLRRWEPPLNLKDVTTPWSTMLSAARRQMADEAREWASERGPPG